MTDVPWPASRRQIDLAGERLRDWWFDFGLSHELVATDPVLTAATGLFVSFREGFQVPVSKTAMGLRSFLRSEGAPVIVKPEAQALSDDSQQARALPCDEVFADGGHWGLSRDSAGALGGRGGCSPCSSQLASRPVQRLCSGAKDDWLSRRTRGRAARRAPHRDSASDSRPAVVGRGGRSNRQPAGGSCEGRRWTACTRAFHVAARRKARTKGNRRKCRNV